MKAIKNLNGVRIRGRRLQLDFAKYDKNGLTRNGSGLVETIMETDLIGEDEMYRSNTRDERSFKYVLVGGHKQAKVTA